jgi:hypothetical protein
MTLPPTELRATAFEVDSPVLIPYGWRGARLVVNVVPFGAIALEPRGRDELKPPGRSLRHWWWLSGLGVLCVAAAAFASLGGDESDARKHTEQLSVVGYRRVLIRDESYPGTTNTDADYLGPAEPGNAAQLLSGPGLTITHTGPETWVTPQPNDLFDLVARGQFEGPGNCGFIVSKFRHGRSAPEEWHLSDTQAADVRSGRLAAIEVSVSCGLG